MPIAMNDKGDVLVLSNDGEWKPAQTAVNPQTGEKLYFDGSGWQGMPKPSTTLRGAVTAPAQGFNESVATTLGAIPDLVGAGMRSIGLPSSEPGFYTDLARKGIKQITTFGGLLQEPPPPQSDVEKGLYAAGRGVGDAASVFIPATGVAAATKGGTVANEVAKALMSQPATQAIAGATGSAVGEATGSPTLGLAASMAVPAVGGVAARAVRPIRPNLDPEQQRLVAQALKEGIPLTPAEQTGAKSLKYMESAFDTLPMTSGVRAAMQQEQQAAFNQAAMAKAGIQATNANPETMRQAAQNFGTRYTTLAERNALDASKGSFIDDLANLKAKTKAYAVGGIDRSITNRVDDLLSKVGKDGKISGRAYREFDSNLGRAIRSTTDGDQRAYLTELRDIVRRGMDASITAEDAAAWKQLRRDYANFAVIRQAMGGAGENAALGNIPPAQLRSALQASVGKGAYTQGAGDLNDIARIGQSLLRKPPDSGTAQRNMMINLLQGGAGGMGVGLATANPIAGAATGAAAIYGPKVAQSIYNSRPMQNYLINGIPALSGVAENAPRLNREIAAALLANRWKAGMPTQ